MQRIRMPERIDAAEFETDTDKAVPNTVYYLSDSDEMYETVATCYDANDARDIAEFFFERDKTQTYAWTGGHGRPQFFRPDNA